MTLAEKLHAIQKLARAVPKKGFNQDQGFSYMRIEDVITVATHAMARHKLLLTPTLKSFQRIPNERGGGSITDLTIVWTVTDMDAPGECRNFEIPGSGWDFNSKSTAKALTDSRKAAMILIFNLKAGDDPEERGMDRVNARDRQQEIADNKLANAAAGKGLEAGVPALFYTWNDETQTGTVTGDKDLLTSTAKMFKEFKFPKSATQWIVNADQLERIKIALEERAIPLKKLMAA